MKRSVLLLSCAWSLWVPFQVTANHISCDRPYRLVAERVAQDLQQHWGHGATVTHEGCRVRVFSRKYVLDWTTHPIGKTSHVLTDDVIRDATTGVPIELDPYILEFDVRHP